VSGKSYISPLDKIRRGGPNSVCNRPTQLPDKLDKFYKDLSSSSGDGEDVTNDNLDKLKSLFKKSNLEV